MRKADGVDRSNIHFPDVLASAPVLKDDEPEFSIEFHCLEKGGTPELCLNHHVIGINTGQAMRCKFVLDGQSHCFPVATNEMNIVPSGHTFAVTWDRAIESTTLNISTNLLSKASIALWNSDQFELLPALQVQDAFIAQIALAIHQELTEHISNQMYLDTLKNALAIHVLRRFSVSADRKIYKAGPLSSTRLKAVLKYIDDNLGANLSIKDLSVVAHLSQYYFSRAFKEATGLSPHQYVIQRRVSVAKQLLSNRSLHIQDIAITCGFNSQSHLNRHFKKVTGMTPLAFREL